MTALRDHLVRLIRDNGPIGIDRYMAEALGHPEYGYYRNRDPFGARGDFVTAPEVSQMFGELIGLWCAVVWEQAGGPAPLRLVELGPGRGTLMADALRAIRRTHPQMAGALDLHLVETSPALRQRQRQALPDVPAAWHDEVGGVPAGPAIVIANEFFDALPIRQFRRTATGWAERVVEVDGEEDGEGRLRFGFRRIGGDPAVPEAFANAPIGALCEACPGGRSVMAALAARIVSAGGAVLAIDYGHARSHPGDTLQAVQDHRPVGVLDTPGEADITAHVDFEVLADAARSAGAVAYEPVPQGDWLRRLGIGVRAERLKRTAGEAQAAGIDSAVARLIEPDGMGTLFKVLAATAPGMPVPPGFET
ncbi:MAG: class I SAM-dependent methyltransferase [Acetobacterales bacterium]